MLRQLPTRMLALLIAALCVATVPHARAQGGERREHKRTERAQIVALERQWQKAALTDDVSAMDKLLSDDYLGITANGAVLTKSQQLDRMRERKFTITRLDTSELKIKLIGNIAIVTSLAQVEGVNGDESLHGAYRYTRVYQRMSSGNWKVTNFEVTPASHVHPEESQN
jgi:ketosteroid isomerase-like protein